MSARIRTLAPVQSQTVLRKKNKKRLPAFYSPVRSPPREEEDSQARFKARIDYLLDPDNEDIDRDLLAQLQAKDTLIDQLNSRLIAATARLKQTELDSLAVKERLIQQLLEEKGMLTKELAKSEQAREEAGKRAREAGRELNSEKEQGEMLAEALTEEIESLKGQLSVKSEQTSASKKDVLELSKIIEDLSKLNGELNEKVKSLNEEMEKTNTEHYKATAKAVQIEDLEQELIAAKTEGQRVQAALSSAQGDVAALKELRQSVFRTVDEIVAQLGMVRSADEESMAALQLIDTQVRELGKQSVSPSKGSAEKIASLKKTVKDLKLEVETQKRSAAKVTSVNKVHEGRIATLQSDLERIKAEHATAVANLKSKVDLLLRNMHSTLTARGEVEQKLEQTMGELQKRQTECLFLQEKVRKFKGKSESAWKTQEDLGKTCNELKLALFQSQSDNATLEASTQMREKRLKQALAEVSVLNEELWIRDNDLLRRETKKVKLQHEVEGLKVTLQSSHSKMKEKIAEELVGVSSQLESKEKQITVLKRMLRKGGGQEQLAGAVDRLEETIKEVRELASRDDTQRKQASNSLKAFQRDFAPLLDSLLPEDQVRSHVQLKSLCDSAATETMTVAHVLLRLHDICN